MEEVKKHKLVTAADLEDFKQDMISVISQLLAFAKGPPAKRWVKAAEARRLIGVSPGKLQVIRDSGLLAFTRIGGNIYYDQEDLYKLFEQNKIERRK